MSLVGPRLMSNRVASAFQYNITPHDTQVLVEGPARGNPSQMTGKTCTMKRVFFDGHIPEGKDGRLQTGDYVAVEVHGASATALLATPRHLTTAQDFVAMYGSTVPILPSGHSTVQHQQHEAAIMHA